MDLARTLRRSENEFVGVALGPARPVLRSSSAGPDHALCLDCRHLDYDRLPLGDPAPAIVVCDSKTSRRLADGMYNRRGPSASASSAVFQRPIRGRERSAALAT